MPKKMTLSELEEKALDYVNTAYKSYSDRSGLEDKWQYWDRIYNLVEIKKNYEGVANLFPPETRRAIETLHDFSEDVLFSADPWFRIEGIDGANDQKKADVYKKVADWQNEKNRIRSKMSTALRRWPKFGFVIVKVPYVFEEKYAIVDAKERKKLKDMLPRVLKGEVEAIKTTQTVYDAIDFQVPSPFNLYWDYYKPWEKQRIIIEQIDHVSNTHLRLMEKKGIYKHIKEVIKDREDTKGQTSTNGKEPMDDYPHYDDLTGLSGYYDDGKPDNTLLEAWCNFDIDGDGIEEECVITVANGTHVIRIEANPYDIQEKPYLWCPWEELEKTSIGISAIQIAAKSQMEVNDFTNQMMDDISEILDCVRVVDTGMIAEGQDLNTFPKKVIKTTGNPADAIQFIRPPNIVNEAMAAVNMAKEDIRNGTGATISLQGLAARYDTTATEYSKQGAAAGRGMMSKIRNFEERIIKPFLRFQYSYNTQYLDRETFIKVVGEEAARACLKLGGDPALEVEVKDAILGDFDFIPLGVTQIENKVVKGQQLINFLNIASKLPPGTVDMPVLVKKIWAVVGDGDTSVILAQPNQTPIDPKDENIMLSQGMTVTVSPKDQHDIHVMTHLQLQSLDPMIMALRDRHVQDHVMMKQVMSMPQPGQAPQPGANVAQQPAFGPAKPNISQAGMVPGNTINAPPGVS